MTLTEFLLARITEDEAVAQDMQHQERRGRPLVQLLGGGAGIRALVDPARVLAECEAKRRIVERYAYLADYGDTGDARWVLPLLALPCADHPDYDETWRP